MLSTAPITDGFALATAHDDADMRALLRRSVVPGTVRVAFTREPDYFAGEGLAGAQDRTLLYRDDGRLVGIARLSMHTLHRNGVPSRIGYLGELRIAPDAPQSPRLLRDGYALLREFVQAESLDACFTSIAIDNTRARRVLEHGGRFGLPTYTLVADLVTLLWAVGKPPVAAVAAYDVTPTSREELSDFLDTRARDGQLTLTWDAARWEALTEHGVAIEDFSLVRANGRTGPLVAVGAIWDQRAFKQTVVTGYEGALRWSRPLVNTLAKGGLVPSLPTPGAILAQGAVLGACVSRTATSRTAHWSTLLERLRTEAARRGLQWMMFSRDVREADMAILRSLARVREYRTGLYDVRWPNVPLCRDGWDHRPFRPEVALL